jgi:hypothetical protein
MDPTDAVSRPRPVSLRELGRTPVSRWRTVAAVAALATGGTAAYLASVPPTYTATSVVVVRAVMTDPFAVPSGGADKAINMTAETGIASGSAVAGKVAGATHRAAGDITGALQVENPVGSQILRFRYTGRTSAEAVTGANAAADGYLELRRGMYETQRAGVVKSYSAAITSLGKQIAADQDDLPATTGAGTSARSTAVLDQLRSLNDQLAALSQQRSKIASADLTPGTVTDAANGPVPSSRRSLPLAVLAALLGGLIIGVLAAFLREALDRRVRSGADAADITGVPLLGSVPLRAPRKGDNPGMGYLALAVAGTTERSPGKPLVVLSHDEDEGRADVTAGLAAKLAEVGHEVYLGVLRHPDGLRSTLRAAQERTPPIGPRPEPAAAVIVPAGAGNPVQDGVLTGTILAPRTGDGHAHGADGITISEVVVQGRVTAAAEVLRIGAGSVRLGPLEPDTTDQLVILDAPATAHDDRGLWAARAGHTLVVARRDRTRAAELSKLMDRLRAAGIQPVGVVLTGAGRD